MKKQVSISLKYNQKGSIKSRLIGKVHLSELSSLSKICEGSFCWWSSLAPRLPRGDVSHQTPQLPHVLEPLCGSTLCSMARHHYIMLLMCQMHFLVLFRRCSLTFAVSFCRVPGTLHSPPGRLLFHPACLRASLRTWGSEQMCFPCLDSLVFWTSGISTWLSCPGGFLLHEQRLDPWAFLWGGLPDAWQSSLPYVTLSALMTSKSGTSLAGERVSGVFLQRQPTLFSGFNSYWSAKE